MPTTETGLYTVTAPGQYANAQLNGTSCVIVRHPTLACPDACEVLLLDGPGAHRSWWLNTAHLTPGKPHA
jgi:hypothetical protein